MKLLYGARDRGLQNPLVMISLCTLRMTLPLLFQKIMHLRMLTTRKKIHRDMDSILSNEIWGVTDRSYGCKHVGC
jgi:hypothetical protein